LIEIALTKVNLPTLTIVTWTSPVCAPILLPIAIALFPATLAGIWIANRGSRRDAAAACPRAQAALRAPA
jgi:hypothetical protein